MATDKNKAKAAVVPETPEQSIKAISADVKSVTKKSEEFAVIKTAEDLTKATEFLVLVKGRLNRVTELESFFTDPYVEARRVALAKKQEIEALFLQQKTPLTQMETKIKAAINVFKKEEERAALAEEKRKQDIRDKANEKREEKGIAPIVAPIATVERTQTTIKAAAGSATSVKVWKYRVVDLNLVPREYLRCEIVDALVKAKIKQYDGAVEIAGLELYQDFDTRVSAH